MIPDMPNSIFSVSINCSLKTSISNNFVQLNFVIRDGSPVSRSVCLSVCWISFAKLSLKSQLQLWLSLFYNHLIHSPINWDEFDQVQIGQYSQNKGCKTLTVYPNENVDHKNFLKRSPAWVKVIDFALIHSYPQNRRY